MAMNTSIYGEQYPDYYDWRTNPLGLRDPRAWVGADDPTRAYDMSANDTPSGAGAATQQAMLDRYNQPGGWWGSTGQNTGAAAPAAAPTAAPDRRIASAAPTTARSSTTGAAPAGNMFLEGVRGGSAGSVTPRGGVAGGSGYSPAWSGGGPPARGVRGTANAGDLSEYMDPGYGFRFAEGIKGLQSGAAGAGNFLSGQTLKDLMRYGQDMASQEYGQAYNRMASDRNYATNLEQWNKTFGRDTSQMDWSNDTATLAMLLNAGLAGAGGSAEAQNLYARLLASLALGKGQANAAGTAAGSNLWSNIVNDLLDLDWNGG